MNNNLWEQEINILFIWWNQLNNYFALYKSADKLGMLKNKILVLFVNQVCCKKVDTTYYSALDNFIDNDKTFGLRLLWTQNLKIQQTCQIYWEHESNSVIKV